MANVSIDELAGEITLAIQRYTEDVSKSIEKKIDTIASDIVAELKLPLQKTLASMQKAGRAKNKPVMECINVLFSKNKPSLVHLLEFGHAKVNGGRVEGKSHVRPAAERHIGRFEKRIKEIVKNGG